MTKLCSRLLDDKVCPDLAKTATQLVFGDGNPEAELVFIGEAPGKNEDRARQAVRRRGRQIFKRNAGNDRLKREDVYITNIVKYRPPNNRDPYPEEKAAFLPYLESNWKSLTRNWSLLLAGTA